MILTLVGVLAARGLAQELEVDGWRAYPHGHFILYTVDGTPGDRDAERVAVELERIYARVLAPLGLPPVTILYPLYPSTDKFQSDWWQFAIRASGETVHAWGTVYDGHPERISPYVVTRAVVAHSFPRSIPLLTWGLGDVLGDRVLGIDSHRGYQALLGSGRRPMLALEAIVPPYSFGISLPTSYPAAVSFVAFLLDQYGPARTAAFINTVGSRYYDFATVFKRHFATPPAAAERRWKRELAAHPAAGSFDVGTYVQGLELIISTTLASSPGRSMLRSDGALIVAEAFATILPARTVDLASVEAHLATVRSAEARRQAHARWTALAVRGGFWVTLLAPIVLAIGWLAWPKIRAHLSRPPHADTGGVS